MYIFDIIVVTYVEHLKKILTHIVDSYHILEKIEDKPGDLAKIEKEMLKINGFIRVISHKTDLDKIPNPDFKIIKTKFLKIDNKNNLKDLRGNSLIIVYE